MALKDFPEQERAVQLLQRSLDRGRLAHAYLFTGHSLDELEAIARALAKALNCQRPVRNRPDGPAIDSCDECLSCRKIDHDNHADMHWVRAESKSRVILIEQMRELMREIHLKPTEAEFKVAVIVAADRLKTEAANAFLKTLEEPPPKSILILLTTEPQRILETILSRCLRLNFAGEGGRKLDAAQTAWLTELSESAAVEQKGLLGRYRLLGVLLKKLAALKGEIERSLTARSPLERYPDVEPAVREKWEEELAAAIEAEYRRQRADLLLGLQWWLRDVWLRTLALKPEAGGWRSEISNTGPQPMRVHELLNFPNLAGTERLAQRILPEQAMENLNILEQTQRLLGTNVQEALVLEVGLLKLKL